MQTPVKSKKKGNSPPDEASLQRLRSLCEQLAQWAFTDFEQARMALDELETGVTPSTPFDIRLAYFQYAAFLENQWNQYERALQHLSQVVGILESLAEPVPLAIAWADTAAVHLNCRDWEAAQECLDRARRHEKGSTDARLRAHIACREGFLHLHLGNHRQALDCLLDAEKALATLGSAAALKDFYVQTLVISGLGDLYERLNDKENSLAAYRRVLPIVEQHRLRPRLAWHYLNAGRAALAQNDPGEAHTCFENVLRFAGEGDQEAKSHALANLGILAFLSNDAERASTLFDQAAEPFQHPVKPSDYTNLSKIESWRAGLLLRQNAPVQAEAHLMKAVDFGKNGHDLHHLRQVCHALAGLHAGKKRYAQAYDWQCRATELADLHFQQVQDRERQELEVRYQLERSRQEAQLARLRVASLQTRALRAQMNPHFLFNALNAIQGFITSGRDNEAATYLARFAKFMRQTLEYSDMEVAPLEQEIKFIAQYLEINRKLRFRDKLNYQIIPPANAEPDDLYIPTMIVQPFVENAIEHGLRPRQEGNLRIEFVLSDDERTLLCIIEDDGVGYNKGREKQSQSPEFQSHRSRGMDITRDRLTLLHQRQKTDGNPLVKIIDLGEKTDGKQSGTRVEVLLPLLDSED